MFLNAIFTFMTGESSEPLSTCVSSRASIAGADPASSAMAGSLKETRRSFAGWAWSDKPAQVISVINSRIRFTVRSPFRGQAHFFNTVYYFS
jgi:hypothetical protein